MIIELMMLSAMLGADPRCAARIGFYQPTQGAISSAAMAAQVAELYLTSLYGADVIKKELPLTVSRTNEVWHVKGTAQVRPFHTFVGGLAEIDLCRSNGQVIRIYHSK